MTFGHYLREKRKERNITQRDLAAQVQVHYTYISKIEHDTLPPPSLHTLQHIAQVLAVPAQEMIRQAGKAPGHPPNWATLLDIIEAGIDGDTARCRAYAELLLERSGEETAFTRHLKRLLEGNRDRGVRLYPAETM